MTDSTDKEWQRIEAYRKELAQDPSSLVFIALAEALNRLSQWDEAAQVARRGLETHPDSVAGLLTLAVAEAGRDNIRDALEQIKGALILDQENPRALALMGSLLLQKGLAKRAAQFLSQAVKLAPDSREYQDLLKRAKRLSKSDNPIPLPVVRGENVPAAENPWTEEGEEATEFGEGEQHTVFNPDALQKPLVRSALGSALPHFDPDDEEPTRHLKKGAQPERRAPASEAGTSFDARDILGVPEKRRLKVGGSAADYSRILRRQEPAGEPPTEDDVRLPGATPGRTGKSVPPPPPEDADSIDAPEPEEVRSAPGVDPAPPPAASEAATVEPPAPAPAAQKPETAAKKDPKPEPPAKAEPEKAEAPPKPEKKAKAKEPPPPENADRPATMMVDEAIWAIYGGEKPSAKSGEPSPKPAAVEPEGEGEARGGMVVRTADWLGVLTFWAFVVLLAGSVGTAAYTLAVARTGRTVSESTEDLRSIVADLERGGLAALMNAEDSIGKTKKTAPDLLPLLEPTEAEVAARIWAGFGHDPEQQAKARALIAAASAGAPSVELLVARTLLSTSAATLAAVDRALEPILEAFPGSPKAWVLRARLRAAEDKDLEALAALSTARDLHPARRETLLELARWHAAQGTYASAFAAYDEIREHYPSDVEAALERFVLHAISGADAQAAQATSRLAGLVREENPDIAKDEAGRVAVAFAASAFERGDAETGLSELSKAEAAFSGSAEFKEVLGTLFLALGEWDRAKVQLERAAELAPERLEPRLGLALVGFGKRAEPATPPRPKELVKDGLIRLPFGVARFRFGAFALIDVDLSPDVFPLAAFRKIAAQPGDKKRLESAASVALAELRIREGKASEAIELLEDERRSGDSGPLLVALGRARLAKGEQKSAIAAFEGALRFDKNDPQLRLGLAEAYQKKGDVAAAIDALEPLTTGNLVVPRALVVLAELRALRGDERGAVELLERARTLDPDDPRVEIGLGSTAYRLKRPEAEVLEHYGRALELDRRLGAELVRGGELTSPVDAYFVGRLLLEKNEKRAIQLLEAAVAAEDHPLEARYYLGKALLRRPRTKKQGLRELAQFKGEMPGSDLAEEAAKLIKGR